MRHDVEESTFVALANNEGKFAAGDYPDFRAVAAVGLPGRRNAFEVIGSCVLVAPDWVLTAAHVVLSPKGGVDFEPNLEVRFGGRAGTPTIRRTVVDVATPLQVSQLRPLLGRGMRFSEKQVVHAEFHDMALLRLSDPVENIPPAQVETERSKLLGQLIYISGFGDGAKGNNARSRSWTAADLKRAAENVVDREINRNPLSGRNAGGILLFDFDNGDERRNSLNARSRVWDRLFGSGRSSATPTQLEGASYPGDSGGPAFAKVDGEWKVVGISGYGTGYPPDRRRTSIQYGDILVYTRVAHQGDWITKVCRIEKRKPEAEAEETVAPPPTDVTSESQPSPMISESIPLTPPAETTNEQPKQLPIFR